MTSTSTTFTLMKMIEMPDINGDTALHKAVRMKSLRTVKMLVDQGANIAAMNKNKETPLSIAAEHGFVLGLRIIFDKITTNTTMQTSKLVNFKQGTVLSSADAESEDDEGHQGSDSDYSLHDDISDDDDDSYESDEYMSDEDDYTYEG